MFSGYFTLSMGDRFSEFLEVDSQG